jgi:hypothetical protein
MTRMGCFGVCALIPPLSIFKLDVRILYPLCLVYGIVVLLPTIEGFLEYIRRADSESLLQGMSPGKPYLEEARELPGTLIALALTTVSLLGRKWATVNRH